MWPAFVYYSSLTRLWRTNTSTRTTHTSLSPVIFILFSSQVRSCAALIQKWWAPFHDREEYGPLANETNKLTNGNNKRVLFGECDRRVLSRGQSSVEDHDFGRHSRRSGRPLFTLNYSHHFQIGIYFIEMFRLQIGVRGYNLYSNEFINPKNNKNILTFIFLNELYTNGQSRLIQLRIQ